MPELQSHADVIELWPSKAEFARATGVSPPNARNMASRGRIPPHLYDAVVAAARKAGFDGITYARLTELGRRR